MKRIISAAGLAIVATATATIAGGGRAPVAADVTSSPKTVCTVWTESGPDTQPPLINVLGLVPNQPEQQLPPQLDLTSESMSLSGSTLVVRIHVVDMEAEVPAGYQGDRWFTTWSFGGQSYTVFADFSTADGAKFWVNGAIGSGPTHLGGRLVTGPQGYAEIDVPLALVGSPPLGAVLQQPSAMTAVNLLDGTVAGQSTLTSIGATDTAGPQRDYAVGQGCA